jgi:hypothetical protein
MRGGNFDRWDLEVRGGLFGTVRLRMVIEEHGGGRQMTRLRSWPKWSPVGFVPTLLFAVLSIVAAIDPAWFASVILGIVILWLVIRAFRDCAAATACFLHALK